MNKLHHLPALRLLIPFLTGILCGLYADKLPSYMPIVLCSLMLTYFGLQWIRMPAYTKSMRAVQGILQLSLLFLFGFYYTWVRIPAHHTDHYSQFADSSTVSTIRITDLPEQVGKNYRFTAEVVSIQHENQAIATSGQILVYLAIDSSRTFLPRAGQLLTTDRYLQTPPAAANPGGFDYQQYLAGLGIYHTVYLQADNFQVIGEEPLPVLQSWIFQSATYIQHLLAEKITNPENRAVGLALIMGDRSLLNADILEKYSKTGTMHILAVSGLHVGILYLILEHILLWIPFFKRRHRAGNYVQPIIILLTIWFYAGMTGLSPSVFRSAVMFSFLALGRPAGRYINSYNILAASAFTLLIINPLMVVQVGFQLSFIAVLGIVAFQPYLAKLWRPTNMVSTYFWSILTVSVAAQIGTAPITIYYFHSFPNYFLLSNCLAIPISFVILCAGLAVLPFHHIPLLDEATSWVLNISLTAMDSTLIAIGNLPGAITDHIHWTPGVVCVMYFLLLVIYLFLSEKDIYYLWLMPVIASCIFLMQSWNIIQEKKQDLFTVYALREGIGWGHRYANQSSLYVSGDLTNQQAQNIWPSAWRRWTGVPAVNQLPSDSTRNVCLTNDQLHIMLIRHDPQESGSCSPDIIVIEGDPDIRIQDLHTTYPESFIIIGNHNSAKHVRYWQKSLETMGVPHTVLKKDGAYQLSLSEQH
jgi:competence protein ComEC